MSTAAIVAKRSDRTLRRCADRDAAPDGSANLDRCHSGENDGEQRAGISDGRVYTDFSSESGFGTVYSGDSTEETDGGTSAIDVERSGDTLVFTFTGTTWDDIDFSGQMMCTGMSDQAQTHASRRAVKLAGDDP
jgi:hypothetical protein